MLIENSADPIEFLPERPEGDFLAKNGKVQNTFFAFLGAQYSKTIEN